MGSCVTDLRNKVIFIVGATATGKSRLSVDLATRFPAEIINSDKIQIYKGLDIATNKVTKEEMKGVPHHLLGVIEDIEAEYTAVDFCRDALKAVENICQSGKVPIIVGGSNTFIEALVDDPRFKFKCTYDTCFIWIGVSPLVHFRYVCERVDQMVDGGLVDEVRSVFDPKADNSKGLRRAIGVPEMDEYLQAEASAADTVKKQVIQEAAFEDIKVNTWNLVCRQLEKIKRFRDELKWPLHQIDATPALERRGKEAEDAWNEVVLKSSLEIVSKFLGGSSIDRCL